MRNRELERRFQVGTTKPKSQIISLNFWNFVCITPWEVWPVGYLERPGIARRGSGGNFKNSESGEAERPRTDPDWISDTEQSDFFLLNLAWVTFSPTDISTVSQDEKTTSCPLLVRSLHLSFIDLNHCPQGLKWIHRILAFGIETIIDYFCAWTTYHVVIA